MSKYYSPNESQMRTAVKGDDRYFRRRRPFSLLRIALALAFVALWIFVFLFGLLDWSK